MTSEIRAQTEAAPRVASDARLAAARDRAAAHLLALQRDDGHWCGELEGDTILESETILILWFLGREVEQAALLRKLGRYLRRRQEPGGGWSQYPGGPPDLSITLKAILALRILGAPPDDPDLLAACAIVRRLGGPHRTNSFTRIYLAILGQYPWSRCPAVPPEIVLAPRNWPVNLLNMSSWSRTIVVPLSVIWAKKPRRAAPARVNLDDLYPAPGEAEPLRRVPIEGERRRLRIFFLALDRVLRTLETLRIRPLRRRALLRCMEWIRERARGADGLGAIFPPILNCLVAMKGMGYPDDHPEVRAALDELLRLVIEDADDARVQPCTSPVWDTAIAINALRLSGLPASHPALGKAADWLVARQIRVAGDWQERNRDVEPGGWCFEYRNDAYPDVDDSIMVMMALSRMGRPGDAAAMRRGLAWVDAMQNADGGFGAFDRDCALPLFSSVPFADHNAMLDPSTPDISARVLEMWGVLGIRSGDHRVERALAYVRAHATPDGAFYGRWGVNYIYGTWQVLRGLAEVGEPADSPVVVRAADWLESVQNPDGGFGETIASYDDPALRGQGVSTASQTAWAVMGLLAAGRRSGGAVARAVDYLVRTQTGDGTWNEEPWTGTGFPKVFYLRYHLYRHYFPLMALGRYLGGDDEEASRRGGAAPRPRTAAPETVE